jgi:response regulator of citrate/malate metabolism
MNDYLSKPVSSRALVEALDKWLPKATEKATRPPTSQPASVSGDTRQEEPAAAPVFNRAAVMDRLMVKPTTALATARVARKTSIASAF